AITMRIEGAGIFEGSSRKTAKYRSGAKIRSLIINGDGTETNVAFYSSYTDLEKDCKTPEGQGANGGHVSTYCEGPENYRVHMYDSAKYLEITVKSTVSRKDISVTRQALDFNLKGRKLEWRYKNGYSFAVILRGNTYKNGEDGLIKYPKEITGEYLFVRGLPGFEAINADVNLRTTKFANEEARKIASEGYVKVKFPSVFEIDAGDYNEMILLAARKGEAWVKSAMGVVMKLAGEFEDTKNRKILLEAPFADGYDEFTMTLVNDGLADDSVRTQKTVFKIKKNSDGIWMVTSALRSWRCWEGRGHQDFSAVMCS
ncbi:MAG: hypothetical protein HKN33_12750, partial [Pyrinomonadaceae bacterium]|nr:hypothetical protein [Pyrinomonadaceae bacterium]